MDKVVEGPVRGDEVVAAALNLDVVEIRGGASLPFAWISSNPPRGN